jgi:hypothetical protein
MTGIRRTIGFVFICIGILLSMSGIGAIIGIPILILGAMFFFIGYGQKNIVIEDKRHIAPEIKTEKIKTTDLLYQLKTQKLKIIDFLSKLDEKFINKEVSEKNYEELKEKYKNQFEDLEKQIIEIELKSSDLKVETIESGIRLDDERVQQGIPSNDIQHITDRRASLSSRYVKEPVKVSVEGDIKWLIEKIDSCADAILSKIK